MANNPYVNKVVYGNNTVMDISDTTAEESDVASGKTFYKASGAKGVGSAVTPDISNCYQSTDSQETDIQDADYFPFYDSSATAKRNTLWSNIKAKLKTYFDTLYATYLGVSGLIETTVGWSTKNILNCDIASGTQTINGLTVNVSRTTGGDLIYIKVSGTATATTDIEVASSVSDNEYGELSGNAYILNGCPSGGSSTTYSLLLRGGYGSGAQDTGSGALISGTVTNGKVYIRIYNGYTANNLQFKPMIRSKYVADDTYEAYHNNVKDELAKKADTSAIPTSLSQLSDDSTHRVVTDAEKTAWDAKVSESLLKDTVGWVGKNKLKPTATVGSRTINGNITLTINEDGTVTLNGTGTGTNDYAYKNLGENIFVGQKVSCGINNNDTLLVKEVQADGTTFVANIFADKDGVTIPDSAKCYVYIRTYARTYDNVKIYPMIRDASVVDSTYEPYHPSVEQCKFDRAEQRALGAKNLCMVTANTQTLNGVTSTVNRDSDGNVINVTVNGTASAVTVFILSTRTYLQNTYTLSGCPSGGSQSNSYALQVRDMSNNTIIYDEGNGGTRALSGGTDYRIIIRIANGYTANNLVFYPMLRLASDPDDTYVPYAMTNAELTDKAAFKNVSDVLSYSGFSAIEAATVYRNGYYGMAVLDFTVSSADIAAWTTVFRFTGAKLKATGNDNFVAVGIDRTDNNNPVAFRYAIDNNDGISMSNILKASHRYNITLTHIIAE